MLYTPPACTILFSDLLCQLCMLRVCDTTCHCLSLLDLFPSLVGLEFHPCCDSVMSLWPMRPSNLPFCKYVIFLLSHHSGPLDGLHIFIRVNIVEHGIVNSFQHFVTFAHIFSNEFTESYDNSVKFLGVVCLLVDL